MIIKILGTGCTKCKNLEENAKKAVELAQIDAKVEKVSDFADIMNYGVMMTPGLVINEEVKSVGKVLSPEQIKKILLEG
ncbi:MAG: TM0996/MTH895 family glutaredoxin-like protein [Candidatus Delongbacteria bacterium]|nr:TM0996/MTH895 family glutaredoxin-like protein [Candidatus Delongbacteria bacterium]MBN2836905.1 TM0996/MTH895 family glutaredoxin-like protein [Candidatus Delongbacteria bacterium]